MSNDRIILSLTADELKGGFELAAPGLYKVEVEEATFGTSKAGNPKIDLTLKSLEDSYKGKFFANVTLTAKAARFSLIPLMKALGHEVVAGDIPVPTEDELIGKDVTVRVAKSFSYLSDETGKYVNIKEDEVEAHEAKGLEVYKRNEVKGYLPADGAAPTKKKDKGFTL